ncbi:hypothetical protein LTR84_007827 [Exophiala bonariae]|uniref:Glutamate--tRNA ligase, mitochondrial n=1 Tax=Exophiala bonariae TaxID=1690606 RepID=A0AAV9NLI8_9EURO|nr:hypothetical protein LTR84_007827 [Exophiala bonariae]
MITSSASPATRWICSSCRATAHTRRSIWVTRKQPSPSVSARNCSTTPSLSTPTPSTKRGKLPISPARTRFAPSPTGNLHLGSIRTALFNYLLAKATNGQFLLRIEDTDARRTIPGAEEKLYEDLKWAGLQWDEGPLVGGPHGPYRQSQRLDLYKTQIQLLLNSGHAYRCFCSPQRLDELNRIRHEKGLPLGYDRKCTHLEKAEADERAYAGEQHVVRFRAPNIWPRYRDMVFGSSGHGQHAFRNLSLDELVYADAILIKSDGYPTYHWANVCDDHDMQITHVVRGSEWMSSTPLHVALYQSLDWTPPKYAHVPLLVDEKGQKLSKRNMDTDVANFRARGYLPEALINFAALLGWSHRQKKEIMNVERLIELFDMKLTKGNTIVTFSKLDYLQSHHMRAKIEEGGKALDGIVGDLANALNQQYGTEKFLAFAGGRPLKDLLENMLRLKSLVYLNPSDFATRLSAFVLGPPKVLPDLSISYGQPNMLHHLRVAASTFMLIPEEQWTETTHSETLRLLGKSPDETVSGKTWKALLYEYLRWALLGSTSGPPVSHSMEVLGRDICVTRIQEANLQSREMEKRLTKLKLDEQGWKGDADGKRRIDKEWNAYTLNAQVEEKKDPGQPIPT